MDRMKRTLVFVDGKEVNLDSTTVEWIQVDRPLENGGVARIHIRITGDDLGINVTKLDADGRTIGSKEEHYDIGDLISKELPRMD